MASAPLLNLTRACQAELRAAVDRVLAAHNLEQVSADMPEAVIADLIRAENEVRAHYGVNPIPL